MSGMRVLLFLQEFIDNLDNKYLKVWFQKDPQTKDEYIMDLYQKIALQLVTKIIHKAVVLML